MIEGLKKRRTQYDISRNISVSYEEIEKRLREVTELVPDAFNMKSARMVLVLDKKQDELWDRIYDVFGGKVPREKIDSFKAGAGTVLFFYDEDVVEKMKADFSRYADNFETWANHANAMLQLATWTELSEMGLGASLQHYNPVIDEEVKSMLDIPASWKLVAEMPFGAVESQPDDKEKEEIDKRFKVVK